MKTKFVILFISIFLVQSVFAQNLKIVVATALKNNSYSSLLRYNRKEVLRRLLEYKLADKIYLDQVWYSNVEIDSMTISRQKTISDEYASLKIKSLYWFDLLIQGKKPSKEKYMLFDTKKNRAVYDYKNCDNSNLLKGFCKYSSSQECISYIQSKYQAAYSKFTSNLKLKLNLELVNYKWIKVK